MKNAGAHRNRCLPLVMVLAMLTIVMSQAAVVRAADDCVALGGALVGGECRISTPVPASDSAHGGPFTISETLHITGGGSITIPQAPGGASLTLSVAGDVIMDVPTIAGGARIVGDASGASGDGATITIDATGNIALNGSGATGALISSTQTASTCSGGEGGDITLTAAGNITVDNGAAVVTSSPCKAGEITIVAGVSVSIDGDILSEGKLSTGHGGPITIEAGCTLTESDTGRIQSTGRDHGPDLVHLQGGCAVLIQGLVASTGPSHARPTQNRCHAPDRLDKPDNAPACVEIWSGGPLTINGVAPHNGEINADTAQFGGVNCCAWIDLFASGDISIVGPNTGTFAVHADQFVTGGFGGLITVKSTGGSVTARGQAINASDTRSGGDGGTVTVEAKANVTLDDARIFAQGDLLATGGFGVGGVMEGRAFSGDLSWKNVPGGATPIGDVQPTGSGVLPAQRGTISLNSCSAIDTTGTVFPVTSGTATSPIQASGLCPPAEPDAPTLPSYVALPSCTCAAPAGVTITKSPKNATFNIGDPLSFTIVVTSTGPGVAQNVTLSDPLPTTGGLTWGVVSTSVGACSINASQILSCNFGNLPANASATVVVQTTNAGGAPAAACTGQKITNVATASGSGLPSVQDTGDYTCTPTGGLAITKSPKNATFTVGQQLTFTMVVTSTGPATAQNVTLSDPLPTTGGLTWGLLSTSLGTCSVDASQVLSCSFGNMAANASATVVVQTTNAGGAPANSCTGQKLTNIATASATGQPSVQDTGDYTCTPPPGSITITKNPKNGTFNIGNQLTFTMVVTSTGPGTAQNVTLSDPLPTTGGLTWTVLSASVGTCSVGAGQVLSCSFGNLAANASATVVVQTTNAGGAPAAACTGQKITNVATGSATGVASVQDTGDYTCTPPPGVTIVKSPKNATFNIGQQLTFSITVTGTGPGTAQNVTLNDPLPTTGGLTWGVLSTSVGTCTVGAGQVLSCNFGNLAANASATVVVQTTNAGGAPAASCTGQKLINVATASATGAASVQDTGDYTCTSTPPALTISKSPKNGTFNIGNQLSFSIVVTSTGATTAQNVTLSDPLPTTGGLTWGVLSTTVGTCSVSAGQVLSCSFGNLAQNASAAVVVQTTNAGGAPAGSCTGQKLVNVATASATGVASVQDTGDYTCTPPPPPGISIAKSPKNATFNAGNQLTFTMVVTSTGPGVAQNVTLSDPLPTTGGLTWGVLSTSVGTCSVTNQVLNCSFGNLPANASATVVVQTTNPGGAPAAACTGQKLNNIATASATGLASVQDTGDYTCTAPPGISITKSPKNGTFNTGDQLTFTIVVTGLGPGTAPNVTLSDPLPTTGGLTWGVISTSVGTCSVNAGQTLSCSFGDLAQGASATVVVGTTNAGGVPAASCTTQKIINTATATSGGIQVQDSGDYTCSQVCPSVNSCTLGYPFSSNNPRTSVVFNESEVLRAFDPTGQSGACVTRIKAWYNDEHALTLGVRRVIVKDSSGLHTTDYPVSPLTSNPGGVTNPATGTNILDGDQAGTDTNTCAGFPDLCDRPLWPSMFITDTTNDPNSRAGDWQFGGTPISPSAVFGTWKGAVRNVDNTHSPAVVTVTPDADPAKNNWNLDGGDPAPPGLVNQGYGAEVRWDVSHLGLQSGHSYRLQFTVHDGDQNKSGGDTGQACINVTVP
ncbi:MAG: hypothetical protein C5B48_08445 [Candidatus Rokuibacteriota bacterium]|nr:MAG: hypothetical protein C5B48_08445 [Candidatus Rokubacteria bacterium]